MTKVIGYILKILKLSLHQADNKVQVTTTLVIIYYVPFQESLIEITNII